MVDIAKLKVANLARWKAARIVATLQHLVDSVAVRLVAAKDRYQKVEGETGVPWAVIAVIHERESSQSWSAALAQGDAWSKVSVHVPRGKGPYLSWEAAAVDALENCSPFAARWPDWSIAGALTLLEEYNGLGYFQHSVPSPYVWASTDQYHRGKYIADGHFDPNAIDHQVGCAALLMSMTKLDPSIGREWAAS